MYSEAMPSVESPQPGIPVNGSSSYPLFALKLPTAPGASWFWFTVSTISG